MPGLAPSRKRSRAYLLEEEQADDDERDELSPRKADMQHRTTPLSSTKKRKLNTHDASKGDAPGVSTLGRKFGNAIGGLLWGKERAEKENLGGLEVDELADGELEQRQKDLYDMDSSGEEVEAQSKVRSTKHDKKSYSNSNSNSKGQTRTEDDVWEVPLSDEDDSMARRSAGKWNSVERAKTHLASAARGAKNGKVTKSGSAKKLSLGVGSIAAEETDEDEAEEANTPSKHVQPRKASSSNPRSSLGPVSERQPSSRKRGLPKKYLDSAPEQTTKVPKGILTPSKVGRPLKSRKSVVFEQNDSIDLGFKDVPLSSASKKIQKPYVTPSKAEETSKGEAASGDDDDDDAACALCSKTHSRKKNQILFCDGCNFAVHQKCYQLQEVPEGDWFCKECQPEEPSEVEEEEAEVEKEAPPPEKEATPEDEDEACEICSGRDSEKGNRILLCDGCSFAVHQKCYDLPRVPRGDWFCQNCKASHDSSLTQGAKQEIALQDAPPEIPDIEGFENHLRTVQRIVLDKLTGQKRTRLHGQDDEMQKVHQLVEQTVLAGEGNSMLVIGARGSGKTTLVESVISDLSVDHRDSFHIVRLNGFIHTDDKLASKEIWRQLGREMEVEDDHSGRTSNYADTMASLLALLSHPSESSDLQSDQTAKSVIFILDEFDLFTTHSRQTLLYNLFDIAQARKAPIAVLGLTTRIDVVESLEKRVKSRFSHRYVHLSLPRSLPAYWEVSKQGLMVSDEELVEYGGPPGQQKFVDFWHAMIEGLYNNDASFKKHIQSQFFRSKSVAAFYTSCILPIANLSLIHFPLTGHTFTLEAGLSLSPPDSKLHILQGLSELELALLIAAARLDIILDTDSCNFAMVYDEYSSLTSRHKIQTSSTGVTALGSSAKVWGRDVALGSWERLAEYEILVPAGIGGGGKDAGVLGRMWRVDVGLEEIVGSVEGLSGVMSKWCREI